MDTRALVLGGGVTGVAWEIGLLAGLAAQGIGLAAADVIIGTSAGSVVGADIACGQEPEALYPAQLAPPGTRARRPDRLGPDRPCLTPLVAAAWWPIHQQPTKDRSHVGPK
jgi:NTE family protein